MEDQRMEEKRKAAFKGCCCAAGFCPLKHFPRLSQALALNDLPSVAPVFRPVG